jgi:hypothetical protein
MKRRIATALLQVARPTVGSEVRKLIRELGRLYGVARVSPSATLSRLLSIDYDPTAIAPRTLVAHARRGWTAVQLVGA